MIGTWLSLGSADIAEILAGAGFDFLVVDLQHTATDLGAAAEIFRVVEGQGSHPLVRLPGQDPDLIGRLLDAGAHGIVVPNVRSAEQAQAAVHACCYPPQGRRGVGLYRAQGYGHAFEDYRQAAAAGILVIAQIECRRGIAAAAEIAGVEGIDALMVGPYDLSADLGTPGDFESPAFRGSLSLLHELAGSGVVLGFHIVEPSPTQLDQRRREGYRLLVYSVDMRFIDVAARTGMRHWRERG